MQVMLSLRYQVSCSVSGQCCFCSRIVSLSPAEHRGNLLCHCRAVSLSSTIPYRLTAAKEIGRQTAVPISQCGIRTTVDSCPWQLLYILTWCAHRRVLSARQLLTQQPLLPEHLLQNKTKVKREVGWKMQTNCYKSHQSKEPEEHSLITPPLQR